MNKIEINKKTNDFIESHGLPKVETGELKFTTITGAINDFTALAANQRLNIEEVKTLLVKVLVRYRYSDEVKDFFEYTNDIQGKINT